MLKQIRQELAKALKFLSNQKFEAAKYDTSEVKISDRVIGGKVELIDADGTLLVAPDGDYELSDGFMFSVKDGVIASIVDTTKDNTNTDNQNFEDISALAIGDEVTMNPEAKEFMPWYQGINFYVSSIDGYGEGCVGLANAKGYYVAYCKAADVTKTGNSVVFPKEAQDFADQTAQGSQDIEALKTENANLKSAIQSIVETVATISKGLEEVKSEVNDAASQAQVEVQAFKSEVIKLNNTILKLAKIPAEQSKTTKNINTKDKTDANQMAFISALRDNK